MNISEDYVHPNIPEFTVLEFHFFLHFKTFDIGLEEILF